MSNKTSIFFHFVKDSICFEWITRMTKIITISTPNEFGVKNRIDKGVEGEYKKERRYYRPNSDNCDRVQ